MGTLILLTDRLADRSRPAASSRPAFFFDLACPFSYLAAESVERCLGDAEWVPTAALSPQVVTSPLRAEAERRAAELRLPLVWPESFPAASRPALRAAAHAAQEGAGARFALAVSRLAFCGGFDIEDPEILAEAAAAAAIPLDACLAAAGDPARDRTLEATSRGLLARGVRRLPAVRVGKRCLEGEAAPVQAAALLRARSVYGKPLAPVG